MSFFQLSGNELFLSGIQYQFFFTNRKQRVFRQSSKKPKKDKIQGGTADFRVFPFIPPTFINLAICNIRCINEENKTLLALVALVLVKTNAIIFYLNRFQTRSNFVEVIVFPRVFFFWPG